MKKAKDDVLENGEAWVSELRHLWLFPVFIKPKQQEPVSPLKSQATPTSMPRSSKGKAPFVQMGQH